jgi:hypothetical protein
MTSDYKDDKKGPISSDREVKATQKGERTVTRRDRADIARSSRF